MATVKMGPLWDRAVFDSEARAVKHRMRTVARFEDVKALRLLEYIAPFEEEQLLNAHPEVEKERRSVELWLDLKDDRSIRVATAPQGGLLLVGANDAGRMIGVPVVSERKRIDAGA
jgi:hypothetical protein